MTETFSCSMTRANKLLAQLRDGEVSSSRNGGRRRSGYGGADNTFTGCLVISHLTGVPDELLIARLTAVKATFESALVKQRLIERWKNRLFVLNIQHGINDVLGEIDLLRVEKARVQALLDELERLGAMPLEQAKVSMNATNTSDKKFDFTWNVTGFDKNALGERQKEISRRISFLDDSKDSLNARCNFSIDLSPEERTLLNV